MPLVSTIVCKKDDDIVFEGRAIDGIVATTAPIPAVEVKTQVAEKTVTVNLKQLSMGSTGAQVKTIQRIIYVRGSAIYSLAQKRS